MNKICKIQIICIILLIFYNNIKCNKHEKYIDLYKGIIGTKDLNNNDQKHSKNDMYVFSDNMLQLSNQFPTISPFESLSLIWSSISDEIKIENKNEAALIILFMINPIYRLFNNYQYEENELFHEIENFDYYLSQYIYCMIQNNNESNCENVIDEFISFLQDHVLYEIQKHKDLNNKMNITANIDIIIKFLSDIKQKQLFKIEMNNKIKLYPYNNGETLLYYLFNINNLFNFYIDILPGIPYIDILNPIRNLLDIINKDWLIEKNHKNKEKDKEKIKNWFSDTSPLKKICNEIIKGTEKVVSEIDQYIKPKKLEKLIILTETKLYSDSLKQLCTEYNNYININKNDNENNNNNELKHNIPDNLLSMYSLLNNEKNIIYKKISKIYENARKSVDINSNLCHVNSDKKSLSSETLSENELYQEISTTLLDLISNFFIENTSDTDLQDIYLNNCPNTKILIERMNSKLNKEKLTELGNQLKDLSSILNIRRTNLASRLCVKINSMLNNINHLNRILISINKLLIPVLIDSILISILPSNKELYSNNLYKENNKKNIVFIDIEKSCAINNFNTLNYYIRETRHFCKIIKDHSTLFGTAMGKIANQKSIIKMNDNLQKFTQSQILHEFREIGRDIKGSKYGHFISEVGNSWSSSLSNWYHFSQKRRKLKNSRKLLRKVFYEYTSTLDNTILELRPELKKIQLAAIKLGTNDIKLLTNGEFIFLKSNSLKNNLKNKYSKHTSKLINKNYKVNSIFIREEFPITTENIKELNSLINIDMEKYGKELELENNQIKNEDYIDNKLLINNNNNNRPYFKSSKIHYVIIGRDFSSFALCQCNIKGSKQYEMLQLFADLLFQIQHYDVRIVNYDLLSHSLKKAIRQMLIIISLNEFALNLLPKVRKDGYQRFYRMKHSTHKALRKRVKKYLLDIKTNTYKLSVVLSTLHTLLLTAFNHFKYDPELELLRRTFIGLDMNNLESEEYIQNNSFIKFSETIKRKTIEKLIGNFYFGRIRRSFSSLKETLLQMMNPQQILGLSQIFKTDKGIKDIEGISNKLYQYFKSIYPSQNCIGIDQGQKLEAFFSLC